MTTRILSAWMIGLAVGFLAVAHAAIAQQKEETSGGLEEIVVTATNTHVGVWE
jgi:hypothetical protein